MPQKKAAIRSEESAICPDVGLPANGTWADNGLCLEQSVKVREALMWKITTRGFTLQEILIMAAMNVAPALIATDKGQRTIWRAAARTEIH